MPNEIGEMIMGKKILQINVKCEDPVANFAEAFLPAAQSIADVKGLQCARARVIDRSNFTFHRIHYYRIEEYT